MAPGHITRNSCASDLLKYLVLSVLFIAVLFFSVYSWAGSFQSFTGINQGMWLGEGYWIQKGQPGRIESTGVSTSMQFQFDTPVDWLKHSIGYRVSTGSEVRNGTYKTDYCHANRLSSGGPHSKEFKGPECDFRYSINNIKTKTESFSYTLLPTIRLNGEWSVFAEYGVSLYKHVVTVESGSNHVFPVGTKTDYTGKGAPHIMQGLALSTAVSFLKVILRGRKAGQNLQMVEIGVDW